eukprot:644356-Rhodomonas_salina.1
MALPDCLSSTKSGNRLPICYNSSVLTSLHVVLPGKCSANCTARHGPTLPPVVCPHCPTRSLTEVQY